MTEELTDEFVELFAMACEEADRQTEEAEGEDLSWLTLLEEDEQQRREHKRLKRLKDCGSWAYWFDAHTGRRTGFTMYCDLFRDCPLCLHRRADQEYQWMRDTVIRTVDTIMALTVSSQDEGNNLIRGLNKTEYARYPQEDGTELIFLMQAKVIKKNKRGKRATIDWVIAQDWKVILRTPEGRNKSGALHMPVSTADNEPFSIINTRQFTTNAPAMVVDNIMDKVVIETEHFKPKDVGEVEGYLRERFKSATGKLQEQGYEVNTYTKKLKVTHSKIDWNVGFLGINTLTLNTKNSCGAREKVPIPA